MIKKKLVKTKPPVLLRMSKRKKRVSPKNPTQPTGKTAGQNSISIQPTIEMLQIPEYLPHGATFCSGCYHKVDSQGTLLLVKNRGKARWVLAHNAHVAVTMENSEVIQNAGEYGFKEADFSYPHLDSEGNLVTVQLQKVEKEIEKQTSQQSP